MVSKAFKQRMGLGLGITFLSFLLIFFSNLPYMWVPFVGVLVLITLLCLSEYSNILKAMNMVPEKQLLYGLSILYLILAIFFPFPALSLVFIFALLVATFLLLILKNKVSYVSVATTLLGWVWITFPVATAYQVNYYKNGSAWLLYVLFVTKMCDAAAYFVGSKFGKRLLVPEISPKKTFEGAIGGIIGAIFTSFIFYYFSIIPITLIESLILGLIIAILTGVGDLAESILKRNGGFKDSGPVPGLGGVFDIMDSLLFTFPFIYFHLLFKWPSV